MRNLTSTRAEGTLISLFTMAEGDSSSSFSKAETDSILSGSAYYSSEDSDTSSVASLSLPVPEETIRPCLFEPERSSSSDSEETAEVVDHPSKERLGNTDWYVNTDATAKFVKSFDVRCLCGCCQTMSTSRESVYFQEIDEMKALFVGDLVPACITQYPAFTSACLCTVVLTIAYHSHRHRYGTDDVLADENK